MLNTDLLSLFGSNLRLKKVREYKFRRPPWHWPPRGDINLPRDKDIGLPDIDLPVVNVGEITVFFQGEVNVRAVILGDVSVVTPKTLLVGVEQPFFVRGSVV